MGKIKIICNPKAGRQIFQKRILSLVEVLGKEDKTRVDISYTTKELDAQNMAYESCQQEYDIIIAIGGDGTINEVVNGIIKSNKMPKLALYPAGTVNDFANFLQIPRGIDDFSKMLINGHTMKVDVGVAGERCFLNVAAAGLLPNVAHKVSSEAKTVLGKFAYYMEGIKEFSRSMFKPIKIRFNINGHEEEKDILFFILANSPSVGGFKYVAPDAKIDDGYLDLLIVEHNQLIDIATIFLKALRGNHSNHPGLQYLQVEELSIYSNEKIDLDIDGELGGSLPTNFYVKKQAIEIIIPK